MKKLLIKLKPLEIGLKKTALWLLSPLLNCRRYEISPTDKRPWQEILLIRHEKIGDVIIALTLVDELKKHFPGCNISFLGSPQNVVAIKDDPRFKNIFVFRKQFREDFSTVLAARREKYDCVIDLITHDSVTSMLLTRLCGPRALKIGIGKCDHRRFYNFHAPHPLRNPGRHIIDFHLDLIKILGAEPDKPGHYAPLHIDEDSERIAMEFMASLETGEDLKIGLNISSGEPTRNWGADNFALLAAKILQCMDNVHLIIITAPHEYHLGMRMKETYSGRVHIIPEGLGFIGVAAIIKKLDMLLSPDTSLVHVAGAFRVPVVALYRRFMDEYKFWRPRHQKGGVVLSVGEMDVFDITVDRVIDEIGRVLAEFGLADKAGCRQPDMAPVVDSD